MVALRDMEEGGRVLFYKDREIRAVIFDIDGTLIDSLSMYYDCLNQELEKAGFQPISKDFLFKNLGVGASLGDILRKIVPGHKGEHVINMITDGVLKRFWEVDFEIAVLPGVEETFAFLKAKGIKIGLATGRKSDAAYEWKKFNSVGLGHYIDTVVTAAEVEKRKPDPDLIVECANKLNVEPKECLVVGDSISDILAARAVDATPIAVCTGVDSMEKLKEVNPDAIIERLDRLKEVVQ